MTRKKGARYGAIYLIAEVSKNEGVPESKDWKRTEARSISYAKRQASRRQTRYGTDLYVGKMHDDGTIEPLHVRRSGPYDWIERNEWECLDETK